MAERAPYPFEWLVPYYRGALGAARALKGRLAADGHPEEARAVGNYEAMLRSFLQAVEETGRLRAARRS